LINCEDLNGTAITKKFKSNKIGSRATHELRWYDNKIEIYESSGITVPEQIMAEKLKKYARIPLGAIVEKVFTSEKPPLFVEDVAHDGTTVDGGNICMTSKAEAIQQAMLTSGIDLERDTTVEADMASMPTPNEIVPRWAAYPENNPNKLTKECLAKLKELYEIGKHNKKQKVGAERAHQILDDTLLFDKWDKQLDLAVPKIKAFFQMSPKKMEDALNDLVIPDEDVDSAIRNAAECERECSAQTLMDDEN
jgi:hypothetical protein